MLRVRILAGVLAAITSLLTGCSSGSPRSSIGGCPTTPLQGMIVHPQHPAKLNVLKACQTYQGVVVRVYHNDDGDWVFDVRPDPGYGGFLSNHAEVPGTLHAEIIPAHPLRVPRVGDHVAIIGTWVLDTIHHWKEIHPVWTITEL